MLCDLKDKIVDSEYAEVNSDHVAYQMVRPDYVVHYTDFSPNRKEALAREVLISNSVEQIESLYAALQEENVKKGWTLHSGVVAVATTVHAEAAKQPRASRTKTE